jgi:hypothetical protein
MCDLSSCMKACIAVLHAVHFTVVRYGKDEPGEGFLSSEDPERARSCIHVLLVVGVTEIVH